VALAKDLSREKVLDAALSILREHGLAALSMRRVAAALGAQPSALYWHVDSKQDLLAMVADKILAEASVAPRASSTRQRLRRQALAIRDALLGVRDAAEVVSFAQALRPWTSTPMRALHDLLAAALPEPAAQWGARTLGHYILGEVAEEQNYAELTRAGIVTEAAGIEYSVDVFLFGIDAILDGLAIN